MAGRLAFFGCEPEIVKCALTLDDVRRYQLPPDFAKKSDTHTAAFVARWGDVSVELDALPASVLRQRLIDEVESRMDLAALRSTEVAERDERARLSALLVLQRRVGDAPHQDAAYNK